MQGATRSSERVLSLHRDFLGSKLGLFRYSAHKPSISQGWQKILMTHLLYYFRAIM